ncbi:MAG: PTS fructose transporter subunit IIA [Rubrivivax sp.]
MAALLIIAHAPLASSLQAVATHVYPDCRRQLMALDVGPGATPEQVTAQGRAALAALGGNEALVLTDVFGATPCNAALQLADPAGEGPQVRVVAGVNVPMLWRTLCYSSLPLDDLVARAVAGGSQGVLQVGATPRQQQGPAALSDDQVQHHHQQ